MTRIMKRGLFSSLLTRQNKHILFVFLLCFFVSHVSPTDFFLYEKQINSQTIIGKNPFLDKCLSRASVRVLASHIVVQLPSAFV